jgi:uncharacterized membrane protein
MTRRERDETPRRLDPISLMISTVSITVLTLFLFFPWLNVEAQMTGLDIVSADVTSSGVSRLPHMEDALIPNGIVIVLPLVQASILFQYIRRMFSTERPRRRPTTVGAVLVGVLVTLGWMWSYTVETTDLFNLSDREDQQILLENVDNESLPRPQEGFSGYTSGEVVNEQFTVEFWLYVMLNCALLVLPWLDQRLEAPPPNY